MQVVWLAVSGVLFIPFLTWFKIIFLPNKEESDRRKRMHQKRRERVDEQARVAKENLRLARIEDAKREAARLVRYVFFGYIQKIFFFLYDAQYMIH